MDPCIEKQKQTQRNGYGVGKGAEIQNLLIELEEELL
jgi:hypothetical protein